MSLKLAARLLGQRRYFPLWAAQTQGAFNDNLFRYALVTMAAYQGLSVFGFDREEMAPIAATAFTLPIFLFSAVAGQVADRFDRTTIMQLTKLAEIGLMLTAAAGFLLGEPLLLLITLFLMGVQTAFFIPARNAAMPTLLAPEELVTANAVLSGAINVAILAGAIGGTLLITPEWGLHALGAILVVCSVLGWLAIRAGAPAPASDPSLKVRWAPWSIIIETGRMLVFVIRAPKVLRPLLGVAWFWMLAAAVITILPLFTRDVLGADPSVVALFQLVFTVGAALGALICGALSGKGDALVFSLIGAIGLIAFPVDLALHTAGRAPGDELITITAFLADPANGRIIVDLAGAAVCGGLFLVPLQAMAQRRATPEKRGRMLAASGVLNGASASLGQFVLFGLAQVDAPLQGGFWFVAIGSSAATGFILWRLAKRRVVDT